MAVYADIRGGFEGSLFVDRSLRAFGDVIEVSSGHIAQAVQRMQCADQRAAASACICAGSMNASASPKLFYLLEALTLKI